MNISMDSIFRKSANVVFRKIGGEHILVPLSASVADISSIFYLNETGAFIWEKIDGGKRLGDIVGDLQAEYADEARHEGDVISFVADLIEAKLIEA